MNLLNLFDLVDAVAAQKSAEKSAAIPPAVQVSQSDGQPATIVVPVATSDEVEVLEDGHEDALELGDEVIITGNVQFKGKTGRVVDFGANKHFVVVDLYNFGKHSFHSSNVEHNEYADSEEEDADWREREDYGTFGDDERDEDLNEGFGAYYYEQLAQKMFDLNPEFNTKGRADELVDAAWPVAVQDLGKKRAQWEFNYDEDFLSDFVSAYGELQRGVQGVTEDAHSQAAKEIHDNLFQGTLNAIDEKNFIRSVLKAHGLTPADAPQVINLVRKLGYAGNKFADQDVAEGLGKSIKRGLQGWYADATDINGEKMTPRDVVRRNKNYDDETLQKIHKAVNGPGPGFPFSNSKTKHSPADLQKRVLDREMKKRGLGEQGVAEEYDPSYDPDYRPYQKPEQDPDAWKQERDLEQPSAPKTVTITDNDGKVVLTFPSTGGFHGDLRHAASKGFDTDSGDYHINWKRNTNEEFDRIKKLAGLK